ncbi:MAG: hypothetical protein AB9872_10350 [Solidesulfovibrio sp.]
MLYKIRKAMEVRDSKCQLAGLIQVDDAFPKVGISKGGDKRGRDTNNLPVLVMVAVKDDAITFAKMEVVDYVNGENIKPVLWSMLYLAKSSDQMDIMTIIFRKKPTSPMISKCFALRMMHQGSMPLNRILFS